LANFGIRSIDYRVKAMQQGLSFGRGVFLDSRIRMTRRPMAAHLAAVGLGVWMACTTAFTMPASPDPLRFWPVVEDGPDELGSAGRYAVVMLHNQQFADLDAAIASFQRSDNRLPDGRTRLEAIRFVMAQTFGQPGLTEEVALAEVRAWKIEKPDSIAAPIVEAIGWRALGWSARGTTYAHDVSATGQALFEQRLKKAAQVLMANKSRSAVNPLWYAELLAIGRGLGWDLRTVQAIYSEGAVKFPQFDLIQREMVAYLTPKWGGSYGEVAQFINGTVKSLPADEQAIMYARLNWQLQETQGIDAKTFFASSRVAWPRMRDGFEGLANRYPNSFWILNNFASFACIAGDRSTYQDVRHRLGTTLYAEAWSNGYPPTVCDQRLRATVAVSLTLPPSEFTRMAKPQPLDGMGAMTWVGFSFVHNFETAQYAELETLLAKAITLNDRLEDGTTALEAADFGFSIYFQRTEFADAMIHALNTWHGQAPQSTTEPIIEAIFWRNFAWSTRTVDARDVSVTGGKLFLERLHRAEAGLLASKATSSVNPLWYHEMLVAARGLQWKPAAIRKLFDESTEKFPNYDPLYRDMVTALSPQWGGSYAAVERFARETVARTKAQRGNAMYANLYWTINNRTDCACKQGFNLFQDTEASWPLMRQGFDDLMNQYPKSVWNLNNFAAFACQAHDQDAYTRARLKISRTIFQQAWSTNLSSDVCDRMLLRAPRYSMSRSTSRLTRSRSALTESGSATPASG
jgi:hypothetical protein